MTGQCVRVWVDRYEDYERAGAITLRDGGLSFAYAPSYSGPAISVGMPLQKDVFSPHRTMTFFSALVPEGDTKLDFAKLMRVGRNEWFPFLARLGDESSGALVFSLSEETAGRHQAYEAVDDGYFENLARLAGLTTIETLESTCVSVTGAMRKVGLYCDEETGSWYQPRGSAPTTHIVKVHNEDLFPLETINERRSA